MSVLIKGMEMPEHCGYCRFRYDGICHALQKTQYSKEECPLVPIPPHGRLIDADALEQDAQERLLICNKYNDQFQKPYEVMRAIALAPTIIQASGSYNGGDIDAKPLTNQVTMARLSPEEFYNKMDWLLHRYGTQFNSTRLAVIDWLKKEVK